MLNTGIVLSIINYRQEAIFVAQIGFYLISSAIVKHDSPSFHPRTVVSSVEIKCNIFHFNEGIWSFPVDNVIGLAQVHRKRK